MAPAGSPLPLSLVVIESWWCPNWVLMSLSGGLMKSYRGLGDVLTIFADLRMKCSNLKNSL
jgi:hypothetical protein